MKALTLTMSSLINSVKCGYKRLSRTSLWASVLQRLGKCQHQDTGITTQGTPHHYSCSKADLRPDNMSRKPSNEAVYSFRPGLTRSVSQWEMQESQPSPPQYSSSSSWDLARPNTSSSGSSTFSSPPPYHARTLRGKYNFEK